MLNIFLKHKHLLYKSDKSKQILQIAQIYSDAKEIWKHQVEDVNITFREEIDDSIEVFASKNQMLQIFSSIINNSLERFKKKKNFNGYIHVIIKKEQNKLKLIIQDNDSTFDEKQLDKLLSRNSQSKMLLSLYTTKQLVQEEFGGSFSVTQNQIGLIFELNLTLHASEIKHDI